MSNTQNLRSRKLSWSDSLEKKERFSLKPEGWNGVDDKSLLWVQWWRNLRWTWCRTRGQRSVRTDGARVWPHACCSDDSSFFLFASTSTSQTRSVPGSSWRLFYPLAALSALKYIDYSYWSAQASKYGGKLENNVKSPLSLFVNTYTTIQPTAIQFKCFQAHIPRPVSASVAFQDQGRLDFNSRLRTSNCRSNFFFKISSPHTATY
jgi:hypothetical protein